MKVSEFDFELPLELIAQMPAKPRDSSRLLHVSNGFFDTGMLDLPNLLNPGDILVFNDTKVIPSRLFGVRNNATVEVTLHKQVSRNSWLAFVRGAKRLRLGDTIVFADDFVCGVEEKFQGGQVLLSFQVDFKDLLTCLDKYGRLPLPPYIKRPKEGLIEDHEAYQTFFAKREGAIAAPTAGLHFTPRLISTLKQHEILSVYVTLHVGAGTFLPVKTENIDDHLMHTEWGEINEYSSDLINRVRIAGGSVVPVGSTSLRLLETVADERGKLRPFSGETDIFIKPGYNFKIADKFLTNFHLPKSTLFMLVAAFIGVDCAKKAYEHAISKRYRFFSYGDACLLENHS